MQKSTLTCFGVGDGWPCANRNHAAFLYRFGKTSLLVDCGEPVDGCLKASGAGYDSIDGILISHLHSDHIGGFFMLMQGFWLEQRRRTLPVFLPGGAIHPLRGMLNAMLLFDELLNFRLELSRLTARRSVSIGEARVTPFRTTHLAQMHERFGKIHHSDFSAFSFLIEANGKRVAHSADLGSPTDLEPLFHKPLDLLVCEVAHFPPQELFLYLRGRVINRIVFVHLARAHWENLGKLRRLAAKMLPDVPHVFAKDGVMIQF